jgi:hypothetical protein
MTNIPLPPDPEEMNDRRSAWAGEAITVFMRATGSDLEDAVSDLIADIRHWCDRHGIPFEVELDRARFHYEAETLADDQPDQEDADDGRGA